MLYSGTFRKFLVKMTMVPSGSLLVITRAPYSGANYAAKDLHYATNKLKRHEDSKTLIELFLRTRFFEPCLCLLPLQLNIFGARSSVHKWCTGGIN